MSIIRQLPQNSRYIPTSTEMAATFNAITPARYDFTNTPACQNVIVTKIQPNTVYLIENLSVGGNIPEEDYLGSIDVFPTISFKNSVRNEIVYQNPIAIVNYFDGLEATAFVKSDNKDANLTLSMSGLCKQLPSMVGLTQLRIIISCAIWAVDERYWGQAFRQATSPEFADTLRRG